MNLKLENYTSGATIVSAAGNVNHDEIVSLCIRNLEKQPNGTPAGISASQSWNPAISEHTHHQRPMELTQFYMGYLNTAGYRIKELGLMVKKSHKIFCCTV